MIVLCRKSKWVLGRWLSRESAYYENMRTLGQIPRIHVKDWHADVYSCKFSNYGRKIRQSQDLMISRPWQRIKPGSVRDSKNKCGVAIEHMTQTSGLHMCLITWATALLNIHVPLITHAQISQQKKVMNAWYYILLCVFTPSSSFITSSVETFCCIYISLCAFWIFYFIL